MLRRWVVNDVRIYDGQRGGGAEVERSTGREEW